MADIRRFLKLILRKVQPQRADIQDHIGIRFSRPVWSVGKRHLGFVLADVPVETIPQGRHLGLAILL